MFSVCLRVLSECCAPGGAVEVAVGEGFVDVVAAYWGYSRFFDAHRARRRRRVQAEFPPAGLYGRRLYTPVFFRGFLKQFRM